MDNNLKTVHEVSRITGVSIRTLHHYDKIGLLPPAAFTESGYRLYDDTSLKRLQSIMMLRELEFPLAEIHTIIDSPAFDQTKALEEQIVLLELKREHLDNLIKYAKKLKLKGDRAMSFEAFDKRRIDSYREFAKEAWGDTDAYKEYEKKSKGYTDLDQRRIAEGLMDIFYEFGDMKTMDPGNPDVQKQVEKLQKYITENYYTCTDEILLGLGEMYSAGGEFTTNIDVAGGKGCAEFVKKAIDLFIKYHK